MQNKTITVVIPCYNYAHFLKECIESVLNQSHKPDEIIVVDDGSQDDPEAVLLKQFYPYYDLAGGIIKYIKQDNGGLSSARNTGISAATSQYIMCLDADDMLRKDAIKEHMAIVDEKSIAQCGLMYFGTQNATFRPTGANLESLLHTNSVYCNSVFPKKAWEEAGGYDESPTMRLGLEDWLFWIECAVQGYEVKTSDYIALLYRRHQGAMTNQTTHPRWDEIIDYMAKKIKARYGMETFFQPIRPKKVVS